LKSKILVIDDVVKNLQLVGETLNSEFVEIITSSNGENGYLLTKKHMPDLILLDVMMPNITGIEVCRQIKADKDLKDIPVIFLTAKTDASDILEAFEAGAVDYITKPFFQKELISRVSSHLELALKKVKLQSYVDIVDKYVLTSVTDKNKIITYASEAFLKRTGYSKEELYGKTHSILKNKKFDPNVYIKLNESLDQNNYWEGELLNMDKDGNEYWVRVVIDAQLSKTGKLIGYQAIMEDITDKKMVEYLSVTDNLTKIYNRRKIEFILDYSIQQLSRDKNSLSILLLDIDNFKSVNDIHGHEVGDTVLQKCAEVIKNSVRQNDSFGRWGGEEFVVVLPSTSFDGGLVVAEKIRTNLEQYIFPNVGVKTCSIGLYEITTKDDLKSAISKADKAMYKAKMSGKNKTVVYNEGLE
jgi:diguanylate cyclase (GGDEF)-like protein/PAS domain S-box-containing protein